MVSLRSTKRALSRRSDAWQRTVYRSRRFLLSFCFGCDGVITIGGSYKAGSLRIESEQRADFESLLCRETPTPIAFMKPLRNGNIQLRNLANGSRTEISKRCFPFAKEALVPREYPPTEQESQIRVTLVGRRGRRRLHLETLQPRPVRPSSEMSPSAASFAPRSGTGEGEG